MATASTLNHVSAMLEQVERNIPNFAEVSSVLAKLIKASEDVVTVSRYGYRMPFKRYEGGDFGKVNMNSGVFRTGTGALTSHIVGAYFTAQRAYKFTDEQVNATSSDGQAVLKALEDDILSAMESSGIDDDITLHTSGNGVLSGPMTSPAASGGGTATNTFTFAGASDYLRVNRIRKGMTIEIWSHDLATKRTPAVAGDPITVTSVVGNVITTSQNVTVMPSGSTGDFIVFPGIEVYGPSTPTTFSSTFPAGMLTDANGIGGDSFRHGITYCNDDTTTNYFHGRQKSAFPELRAVRVNANSAAISWAHGRLGVYAIERQYPGVFNVNNLIGLANRAQLNGIEDLNVVISNINLTPGGQSANTDMFGYDRDYGTPVPYCGLKLYADKRQAFNRIDTFDPSNVCRVQLFPTRWVETSNTGKPYVNRLTDATTGNPKYNLACYIESAHDWLWKSPSTQFYIDNLAVDATYLV